jgi:UDP-hydrolysing UDP-N-acetyl-D-glucosamine 2-epimerase
MQKRKICVVTGTRAEYGLHYWLMREIQEDPDLELQLVVTGMHLSPEFGLTYRNIEEDNFKIDEKVEMLLSSDTPVGIAKSIGLGVIGMADVFARLHPDILVILGDRFETFAAAQAAMTANIPIAHIHGGETTEGVLDEAMRHAITKMAHVHFVAAEPYRNRVIQMGESPARVWNYGAPGLDNMRKLTLLDRESFQQAIGFDLGKLSFLVTYHPVTLSQGDPRKPFSELLGAIDSFPESRIVFTKSNADPSGRVINQLIDEYVYSNKDRAISFVSMGQLLYLSALKHIDVVMGNSSSGIIEAPFVPKPTVNIGDRQKGRLRASSVIDCREEKEDITNAIRKAISPQFNEVLRHVASPYGDGDASARIMKQLKEISLAGIIMKSFHDIGDNQRE